MEFISQIIDHYIIEIVLIIAFLSIIVLIIGIINYIRISKVSKRYKKMMRGMDNKNLEYMLNNHMENMAKVSAQVEYLDSNVDLVSSQLNRCIQRVGLVRYNPFNDMGSDQSFSLALLDSNGDGVVLTSLYARDSSAIFAKPLIDSKSKYPLSKEEEHAIELTLKS
ncbi:MAG TPA: DUF4446 family protein [Clostridia bacterium]|nr:DUF4446 family protein [Clostridia bacterium]